MADKTIPDREFGSTGLRVTRVGLGGEGILRTWGRDEDAARVIAEAVTSGIGCFDTAPAYSGSQGYYGAAWATVPQWRAGVFQTSKSASRDAAGAMSDLMSSLATLATDHLDLWQIHDLRDEDDLKAISGPGGALEAFIQAKEQGLVRTIGVTGHHDPAILTRAVKEWPVDAVLLPVNPVEAILGGFMTETLSAAREKGLAVIAMKVLGATHYIAPHAGISAPTLIRYALSQPVTTVIVGCHTTDEVRILAETGRDFEPMSAGEQERLVELYRPVAKRLAFYRGVI